jgi:hypothetical protein
VAEHRSTSGVAQGLLARSDPALNGTGKPIDHRFKPEKNFSVTLRTVLLWSAW